MRSSGRGDSTPSCKKVPGVGFDPQPTLRYMKSRFPVVRAHAIVSLGLFAAPLFGAELVVPASPLTRTTEVSFGEGHAAGSNGRFVVFASPSRDVTPGVVDPDSSEDIFFLDRDTGHTERVSRGWKDGAFADGSSRSAVLSADGSVAFFLSSARNLIPNQSTEWAYVYDLTTGEIQGLPGFSSGAPNRDGSRIVGTQHQSDGTYAAAIYERLTRSVRIVSHVAGAPQARVSGYGTDITPDGRWVAFVSASPSLVDGFVDGNGDEVDLYLYDTEAATAILVSRSTAGGGRSANAGAADCQLSDDGRFVAFRSRATDLVVGQVDLNQAADLFLFDRLSGAVRLVTHGETPFDAPYIPYELFNLGGRRFDMSADGSVIAVSTAAPLGAGWNDLNYREDVYLYDSGTGSIRLASHAPQEETRAAGGFQPTLSRDGRYLAFVHSTDPLDYRFEVSVLDRLTERLRLVGTRHSGGLSNGSSKYPRFAAQGTFLLFSSTATDLNPNAADYDHGSTLYGVDVAAAEGTWAVPLSLAGQTSPAASLSETGFLATGGRAVLFRAIGG